MSGTVTSGFDGRAYAAALSTAPGVYRMYATDDTLLYVGKAGALRKRVGSYFNGSPKSRRIMMMLAQVARMDVTVTRTEAEALLLENQLIKSLAPRYNVSLRDDKTYPQVLLTREQWPRIALHRGPRSVPGRYYGPYPGVGAVRETLNLMHKLFKLRSCEDSVFRNRSRPCLQYQIGRCSAPCVELVAQAEYDESVRRAALFLEGRSDQLADELVQAMQQASDALEFERAARLRDLVASLRSMQNRQYVDGRAADLDVLACAMQGASACVLLLAFRDGRNLGTRAFFPRTNGEDSAEEVLGAFVSQYYAEHAPPPEVLLDREIPDAGMIEAALASAAERKVVLKWNVRGERAGYVELASRNAQISLVSELDSRGAQHARSEALRQMLGLAEPVRRVECFDISHTMGEATVASCVVFDAAGPVRAQYRRYNISGIEPGDDYAAMRQAIDRRFRRALEAAEMAAPDTDASDGGRSRAASRSGDLPALPDVLLIDGGAGQLAQAQAALADLGVEGVLLLGVAKGVERRAGHEALVLPDGREIRPGAASPALQFIQQVRDEAHRFAITGHRGRRQKARMTSRLEDIPGIGPRRRASLLKHFGGLAGLKAAGEAEIARVEGINAALATRIYANLHGLSIPDPAAE
ncbi:excinuclease ABC subunit UvrC [Stenotrophomonas acidaminiphila]|uniref:excinuclease ABC subunit UvrC n=1 Tax=Stenotrophomonas acidaminiphila TaxID=128780 RepID=UPI0013758402|nr:excinuclease ABC subunit UvrC [Stenotrophomonas acidaminiphila]